MEENNKIGFKMFFEQTPPGVTKIVHIVSVPSTRYSGVSHYEIAIPEIILHCDNENCNGDRYYLSKDTMTVPTRISQNKFITFTCKNCEEKVKMFAINFMLNSSVEAEIYKIGEVPQFGKSLPSKLISLIGGDREIFLNGWRCENKGLGIGAFAYYRRVVENQKGKIFDEIIKTLKKVKGSDQIITELEQAKSQIHFTLAVESIKAALPDLLYIEEHNPLTLIHQALSDGIHSKTDEECLELATSIRQVLTALTEKMAYIASENKELHSAVSKLLNRKKSK